MRNFFIFLCFCVCCTLLKAQNSNAIQEAMADYDYETVLSLIEQEAPTLPLLYQKGKALKGLNYNKEALKVFQEIAAIDSLNPRAYIEVAECCKLLALYKQALIYYQKALTLNPENKYVHLQYIKQLMHNKNHQEALKESALLAAKDSSAQVLNLKAECTEYVLGPTLGTLYAIEAYQLIQRKFPDDYLSAAKLGKACINLKQYQAAIHATEKYRAIDSTNVIINRLNAQAYCLEGVYPTAIDRYEVLLQNSDSTFHTCLYAGISYYANKDYKHALLLLERALKENDSDVNAHYYMGRVCARTGQPNAGVEHINMALDLAIPQDSLISQLYSGLVDCYKTAGKYEDQAATLIKQYKQYAPDRHILLYNAAYVYLWRLKNIPKAKQLFIQFLATRSEKDKERAASQNISEWVKEVDEEDIPTDDLTKRYISAEYWLDNILKQEKQERFFKGEIDGEKKESLPKN